MKTIRSIQKFIFSYDWEIVEVQGSIFKITWGVWLLLPFETFRTVEGYNAFGDERVYGIVLLILGLVHFMAIASHKVDIRRNITFLAFLFWLFSAIMVYTQAHTAAIIPMFVVIAFFMAVNFIRLGRIVQERRAKPRDI